MPTAAEAVHRGESNKKCRERPRRTLPCTANGIAKLQNCKLDLPKSPKDE
jgi:hypothetical protein